MPLNFFSFVRFVPYDDLFGSVRNDDYFIAAGVEALPAQALD